MNPESEVPWLEGFELEADSVEGPVNAIVRVLHATSAGDFLPFTPLPKRYHGRNVMLVVVDDEPTQADGYSDVNIVNIESTMLTPVNTSQHVSNGDTALRYTVTGDA
jgi:hypothetical protein